LIEIYGSFQRKPDPQVRLFLLAEQDFPLTDSHLGREQDFFLLGGFYQKDYTNRRALVSMG